MSTPRPDPESLADPRWRAEASRWLESRTPAARVAWGLEQLPAPRLLSSSFGAQSAVMLHLTLSQAPELPVALVDTGYLFPETYQHVDRLRERLGFTLWVAQSELSPGWFEARHGRLWERGLAGLTEYNRLRKVEPFRRLLEARGIRSWFAGLRRQQARSRSQLQVLEWQDGRAKLLPLVDQSNRDLHHYLVHHDLPYHPLWERGYASIGDVHSTAPLGAGLSEEQTRFFGLKRECGLHEPMVA